MSERLCSCGLPCRPGGDHKQDCTWQDEPWNFVVLEDHANRLVRRRYLAWQRYHQTKIGGTPLQFAHAWFWVMTWDAAYHESQRKRVLTETERELDRR